MVVLSSAENYSNGEDVYPNAMKTRKSFISDNFMLTQSVPNMNKTRFQYIIKPTHIL